MRHAAGMYGTALQAAGCMGMDNWDKFLSWSAGPVEDYLNTITLLLKKGADPNVKGGNLS
jgi:hypothetical protein